MKECSVMGCDVAVYANGVCRIHYDQIRWHGSVRSDEKNECVDCGDFYEIRFIDRSHGDVVFGKFDKEDMELVRQHRWRLSSQGYIVSGNIRLHRLVMGAKRGYQIDHRKCGYDHRRDCRKENLRFSNQQQNTWNSLPKKTNTSGRKGVFLFKKTGKWVAMIKDNGRTINLGYYLDIDDASRAYDQAAIEMRGQFAATNANLGLIRSPTPDQYQAALKELSRDE